MRSKRVGIFFLLALALAGGCEDEKESECKQGDAPLWCVFQPEEEKPICEGDEPPWSDCEKAAARLYSAEEIGQLLGLDSTGSISLLQGEGYTPEAEAGEDLTYRPEAMEDIDAWVQHEGEGLIFIYGENDPVTAGAFELGDARDSLLVTAPDQNHRARIAHLYEADRAAVKATLDRWMSR